jgi:cytochrome c-type biogenesis protein CcmH/NrfG
MQQPLQPNELSRFPEPAIKFQQLQTGSENRRYDNIQPQVKRQLFAISIVCLVVGFILGFFVNEAVKGPGGTHSVEPTSTALPENHPSPEVLKRLNELMEHLKNHPNDRESLVQLGNSFYDMGRFDAAIKWYEQALELEPSDIDVLTDLGTAYLYTGNHTAALERFRKSLEIDENHAQTLQNMGVAYFSTGEYKKAVEVWERLIEAHPDYVRAEEIREQIKTARLHMEQQVSSQ